MGDVGFFVAEAHGADEAFVFDGPPGEAGADEGGFGYHAFPAGGGGGLAGEFVCVVIVGGYIADGGGG